jgi:hypothetical protein
VITQAIGVPGHMAKIEAIPHQPDHLALAYGQQLRIPAGASFLERLALLEKICWHKIAS